MTTIDVRKVHCDRCKRVEEKPLFEPMSPPPIAAGTTNQLPQVWTGTVPTPAFAATILEESPKQGDMPKTRTVEFRDLCGPCKRTIAALLEQIGKKIDGLSPERAPRREAKKKEVASSSKATSQNHSAAAGSASGKGLSTGMRSS